jgi:adenosylmethionine-8-amino-7-oxononanoate aminotransferase
MAFQFWQNRGHRSRRKFIALRHGYHGDTLGSVGVGGIEVFHEVFRPLLFETDFVSSPNTFYHPAGRAAGEAVLGEIDSLIRAEEEGYCAVVVEPLIQGAAGMLTHATGFLKGLRELTRERNVLLIVDEVATGFARTGSMFACEQEGVTPDLMCLGKGLTAGYLPVAATMTTREVFDCFCGDPAIGVMFDHGHTYTGNALGCAVAVASIDRIHSTGLLEALPAKIDYMTRRLDEVRDHPHVADIRQCGMMVGVDLQEAPGRPKLHYEQRLASDVCARAQQKGLVIRPLGNVMVLMPAPGMDMATLERMMDAVSESIHEHFA